MDTIRGWILFDMQILFEEIRYCYGCNYYALFGLVVRWYSWISEQVMAKEINTWSFSSVVSGWMKVTKESHSQACLAQ